MKLPYLSDGSLAGVYAWARDVVRQLNAAPTVEGYQVFANDTAAAAGNVGIGDGYVTPDGFVKRRIS